MATRGGRAVQIACNASLLADGGLDSLFERLASGPLRPRVLSSAPWLLQLDDFVPRETSDGMIAQAGHFRPSTAGGRGASSRSGYRISNERNSTQWGCPMCGRTPAQRSFAHYVERVVDSLGLPRAQSSDLVLIRYGAGGYYRRHHDYFGAQVHPTIWRHRGPRQLTLMTYLSDNEENAGGATRFYLGGGSMPWSWMLGRKIDVQPRAGRALLWANVDSGRPLEREERTFHEARLLTANTKYVVTTWFHACDPA